MDSIHDFSSLKQGGCGLGETASTRLTDDVGSKALGSRATGGADSSLLRRSVKGLLLGGLADSCGYALEN